MSDMGIDEIEADPIASSVHDLPDHSVFGNAEEEEECPPPVKRKRRKIAQPEMWTRNIIKKRRSLGQEYVNRKGIVVKGKVAKREDCSKCRFNCTANFDYETQVQLCKEYWNQGNSYQQKLYLSSLMVTLPVSRRRTKSVNKIKSLSRIFYLQNAEGEKKRVCRKFFCATFAISHRVVEVTMREVGYEMASSNIIKDEYDQADDDVPDNIYESSSSPNAPIFNSISLNPPTQRSKRKTVVNSHDEDPLQTQRNQRAEEDEFDIVGKNFAYKLRGLPKTARTVAEKLMSDILFQAELGNVGVNTTITINNTD